MPHASREPRILKDRNLENEDIFEIIRNPPEEGAIRIFEKLRVQASRIGTPALRVRLLAVASRGGAL